MDLNSAHPSPIEADLQALISAHHTGTEATQLQRLCNHVFHPQADSATSDPGMTAQDRYGALLDIWHSLQRRDPQQTLVRAYNPDPQRNHWHSSHSIIEIVMDDMPFIVASCATELARQGLGIHRQVYPIYRAERDDQGRLLQYCENSGGPVPAGQCIETLVRFEIDRQTSAEVLAHIESRLQQVLLDVRYTVEDWKPLLARVEEAASWCEQSEVCNRCEDNQEAVALLRWMASGNFLFVGFRFYRVESIAGKRYRLTYEEGSGLGCFRDPVSDAQRTLELDDHFSRQLEAPQVLVLTKSSTRSTVQQQAHFDYIGVKKTTPTGEVIGEWRFFGLYSSKAYDTPITQIPRIRQHVQRLLDASGMPDDTHGYKALRHIIYGYPRDELLQASYDQLHDTIHGMLECVEQRRFGVFLRPDSYGRFINVMMLVPRDQYTTNVRIRVQDILLRQLQGHSAEYSVRLSEQPLAMIQFSIHCKQAHRQEYSLAQLRGLIADAIQSWQDKLHQALQDAFDEAEANRLFERFGPLFPAAYRENHSPRTAVADIRELNALQAALTTQLYRLDTGPVRFKVLGRGHSLALSDVLPILEHLGVRVLDATPYVIGGEADQAFWIIDFRLDSETEFDLGNASLREQFQQSFIRTYYGELEDDRFNQLILGAGISYHQVTLLRALCKYLLQLGLPFSQHYIEQALCRNPDICLQLLALFQARFDPEAPPSSQALGQLVGADILAALENVENLDEDRILRHYLGVVNAMLRTNYYQADDEREKGYLSFKLNTRALSFAPEPRPAFEIFVYAPWVEGVHLRAGPIARGGLRWSDRREDFRTEVLGLVKAQMVKNSVIVPVGAKGGFVPKQLPPGGDRNAIQAEVVRCYETFIRGLLDITDNRVGDDIVSPDSVVCHDGPDPYLVVAADKGTATFSDIANRISAEYGFWLGDAFASGGSNGYDHKKMGITARGGWESVKRLFREQNRNCQSEDFSVVGIGDMAGDVFGNGMLLSRHICLVAAFNHQHIFIDPTPNADASWPERKRLFELPGSSWSDYDQSLVSAGGGLYKRSAKHIDLSPEAQAALGTEQTRFTPNELIRVLLKAPLDLLWNGGIGTYIKASGETHEQVGDRNNDNLRVDANELRVKVIGEGGNLGLTQRARIEFARQGGLINTDAIDNAGGVDSSDHEVNLKILLDQQVLAGTLGADERNPLLESMTEDIARLVLRHSYGQCQILSAANQVAPKRINDHRRLIQLLEKAGRLNRKLEYLPSDEQLDELARNGQGLTRPEIAVLLSYSKLWLCDQLIEDGIGEDAWLARELHNYFPPAIQQRFGDALAQHPLHAQLTATHSTNLICNRMGSTLVSYLQGEAHCSALDALRAWVVAHQLLDMPAIWRELECFEYQLDDSLFRRQLLRIHSLLERTSLWLLRTHGNRLDIADLLTRYGSSVTEASTVLVPYLDSTEQARLQQDSQALQDAGLPAALALRLAGLSNLSRGLEIVALCLKSDQDSKTASRVYFTLEQHLELSPLRKMILALPERDLWQRKARRALSLEVDGALFQACAAVLSGIKNCDDLDQRLQSWQTQSGPILQHLQQLFSEIRSSDTPDLPMLSVVVRELSNLRNI
ncbi:NAD-glutamate dehydrogenase [Marinobacterium rhizophilum]|uniref:NAD-glutamate dehydrogenase n=1 Tax=Marinobacterium rhizophilum TaxID=420402 RepID=A0ABY5HGL2_9GAMM|nr:NAD-glutamate dehydrogenase [Marinobacterium rhizophilum]UTW11259.1 NAD-glutamate dehydrogenase [Marinobacterium rhizophilum]